MDNYKGTKTMKTLSFETDAMRRIYGAVDSIDWQSYADDPEPRHLAVEVALRHDPDMDPALGKDTYIVRVWQKPYLAQPTPINIYYQDAPVPRWKVAESIKHHIDQHHDLAQYGLAANKVGTEGIVVTKLQHRHDHLFEHWQTKTNLKRSFETDPFRRIENVLNQIDWQQYSDVVHMGPMLIVYRNVRDGDVETPPNVYPVEVWRQPFGDYVTLYFGNYEISTDALMLHAYQYIEKTLRPSDHYDVLIEYDPHNRMIRVLPNKSRGLAETSLRFGFETDPFKRLDPIIDQIDWDEYNDTAYMGTIPLVLWDVWGTGVRDEDLFTIHIWLNRFDDPETLYFDANISRKALLDQIYRRITEAMHPQQYPDISVVLRDDRIDMVSREHDTSSSLRLGFEIDPATRIQQLIDQIDWSSWVQHIASGGVSATIPVIAMFGWENVEGGASVDVQPTFSIFPNPLDDQFIKIFNITEGIDFGDLRLMTFNALNNAAKPHGIGIMITGNTLWATDLEQYRQTYD